MANALQLKKEALATIDAALTITNNFPNLNTVNTGLSFNISTNPFSFLMDALKNTEGYDTVINIISSFLVYHLESLEVLLKSVLITNIQNILSCSINPIISDDLLLNGITFDLKQIDITDLLMVSPLDEKIGKCFYFDCDEIEYVDELKKSKDFNALLWYMKNKAMKREVWGKTSEEREKDEKKKDKKSDGIITLEYTERGSAALNAIGNSLNRQTPYNNCIHIFLGNTTYLNNDTDYISKMSAINSKIVTKNNELYERKQELTAKEEELSVIEQNFEGQKINNSEFEKQVNDKNDEIQDINSKIEEIENAIKVLENGEEGYYKIQKQYQDFLSGKISEILYKPIEMNYYHNKTLFEFNYDYITSIKLFDAKAVAAQLLDNLTNALDISFNFSYSRQVIKYETMKMVQSIVNSDDAVVSDCFFSFSNEDYDAMLNKAELVKSGLFTINGEENNNVILDPDELFSQLNTINKDSTQEEILTAITNTLNDVSSMISDTEYKTNKDVNFGIKMNFIENLLNNLACVISMSVLSPKLYILIMTNLKIMGMNTNYNLQDSIAMFKQLLTSLIRSIRDELLKCLLDELLKILAKLAAEVSSKIAVEQAYYYSRLIKKLIDCFKKNKSGDLDFEIDDVNHADIVQEEEQPKNYDC